MNNEPPNYPPQNLTPMPMPAPQQWQPRDGMWVEESEDQVVERTGEVYPGLMACGMSVSTTYHLPRMGPTFGGMLVSGHHVADLILKDMGKEPTGVYARLTEPVRP